MERPPLRYPQTSLGSTRTTIPTRRSSQNCSPPKLNGSILSDAPPLPPTTGEPIPSRGRSQSPIRRPALRALRKPPSRTFVPSEVLTDIVDFPKLNHPRIVLSIHRSSSLFVGGATVEGEVSIVIDEGRSRFGFKSRPSISIDRITVTLIGVERSNSRRRVFRALATELIDDAHPPPAAMIGVEAPETKTMWALVPSCATLPFRLDLPVIVGPPPLESKKTGIYYLLSITAGANITSKRVLVRKSQKISVLTVHDPEKALLNLPNPLLASDDLHLSDGGKIKLTAGLHRQTWISGYSIFVDIHIVNSSRKAVRSIELQLEKVTVFHKAAGTSTDKKSSDLLRLPDHCEKEVVRKWAMKETRDGWQGVKAHSEDIRTCQLELPSGMVSIDSGRFFGLRYFLNIHLAIGFPAKHLVVQLPITLIHPSSVDIPPNFLAQVAAAIQHKHRFRTNSTSSLGSPYCYRPGQAFLAARQQSHEMLSALTMAKAEVETLMQQLEGSPRKQPPHRRSHTGLPSSTTALRQPRVSFDPTSRPRSRPESQGPRLQRGTSGVGFDSDSDKENRAPRGRKSSYRYMRESGANRRNDDTAGVQRELDLARKGSSTLLGGGGWRNVAADGDSCVGAEKRGRCSSAMR